MGTIKRGTMNMGTIKRGTMNMGTMKVGTMSMGTMKRGTMKRGTMKRGTMKRGTMKRGTIKKWMEMELTMNLIKIQIMPRLLKVMQVMKVLLRRAVEVSLVEAWDQK